MRVTSTAEVVNPTSALIKKCEIKVLDHEGQHKKTLRLYTSKYNTHYNIYYMPRALFQGSAKLEDNNWSEIDFTFTSKLYPVQEKIFNRFKDYYKPLETFGGIIKANTGTGKTVMALKIAEYIGLRTLVIVPTTYLLKQWIERIEEHTNIKDIGIIQESKCQYQKPIVVGMLKSLAQKEYPEEMYNAFGLTIYDEGHLLGAETFSTVAPKFWDKFRLMLSATPRRKDNAENAFKFHIGDLITESKKENVSPKLTVIKYHNSEYKDRYFVHPYTQKFTPSRFLTAIATDNKRNKLIAKLIKETYTKGRSILVLSDRVEQLKRLKTLIKDLDYGFAIGAKKDTNHRIILATYQVGGLGLDIQNLDTLIFATPRTDIEQAVGRITRKDKSEYKLQPMVIDIVDTASKVMEIYYYKREQFYNQKINERRIVNVRVKGS